MLFAMPACVAEIWSQFRASAGSGTLASSLRARWDSEPLRSGVDATRKSLRKILGAHLYIDAAGEDAAAVLQRIGGARAILASGTSGDAMARLVGGLAVRGKLIVVGAPEDPIPLNALPLIFGGRSVYGSLTGTPIDNEDTVSFSVLENIRPMIETVPLEEAADAYARMMQGKARFRMVLVTKDGAPQSALPAR